MFEEMVERFNFDALRSFLAVEPVTNEEIIRHNICNVELQPNICDV